MLYPVELPVHSEQIVTMSLVINQVNAFEDDAGFGVQERPCCWRIGYCWDSKEKFEFTDRILPDSDHYYWHFATSG